MGPCVRRDDSGDGPHAAAPCAANAPVKSFNVTAIDAVVAGAGRWAAMVWVDPGDVSKAAGVLGSPG